MTGEESAKARWGADAFFDSYLEDTLSLFCDPGLGSLLPERPPESDAVVHARDEEAVGSGRCSLYGDLSNGGGVVPLADDASAFLGLR